MIDGTKAISVNYDSQILLDRIDHKEMLDKATGKTCYPIILKYGPIKFKVFLDRTEMAGSLHSLYNWLVSDNNHNCNQVARQHIWIALKHLKEHFNFQLSEWQIINLEYGFNVHISDLSPKEIIRDYIKLYFNKEHYHLKEFNGRGICKEFKVTGMIFKIYDKSAANNLPYDMIRLEVKWTTSRAISNLGIQNLSDLERPDLYSHLHSEFLKRYNKLLIIGDWKSLKLNNKERDLLQTFTDATEIIKLKNKANHQMVVKRERESFEKVLSKHGLNTMKLFLKSEINNLKDIECDKYHNFKNKKIFNSNVTKTTLSICGINNSYSYVPELSINNQTKHL